MEISDARFFKTIPAPNLLFTCDIVHLERLGAMPEETIRFYVAQLSSALAFLHDNNIMHRLVYSLSFSSRIRVCLFHLPLFTSLTSWFQGFEAR